MKRVTIVGGGLAGLTLGILLRREAIDVTVLEAGEYPRHRVCGEFISGRGISVLSKLGVHSALRESGVEIAETVQFFEGCGHSPRIDLPSPAWCLSRWRLDAILAEAFQDAGGEIKLRTRWEGELAREGWIYSGGRQRAIGRVARWVGVKFHLSSMPLGADLEMHLQSGAYVGLCRVEQGRVNVCALLPEVRVPAHLNRDPVSVLGDCFEGSLKDRLKGRELIPGTVKTVAGLGYASAAPLLEGRVCLGDAQGMIPPITGNGMSMALEGAVLAGGPLLAWARGSLDWEGVCREIRLRQAAQFSRRLRVARWLEGVLVNETFSTARRSLWSGLPWLLPIAFRLTR